MTPLKSHLDLWSRVASTFSQVHPASISTALRRGQYNPTRFLTKELPQLGKTLDQGLACGHLPPLSGFKTYKGTVYPVFLRELFSRIFDRDGAILDEPDCEVIRILRTLLFMFYKYELPFDDEQLSIATQKFIDVDSNVKTAFNEADIRLLEPIFNQLMPDNFLDIRPRHSGGQTADRVDNVEKRRIRRYIPELIEVFDASYFFNTRLHMQMHCASTVINRSSPHARVTFVPKDSRGPRTICMEPHERMFIQQGIMHKLYEFIEHSSVASGFVNFTNQGINQELAYRGSLDGSLATIDLKDASDMVSWELIKAIIRPDLLPALQACRSTTAQLPDGTVVELKKFAAMGSALCFPIEACLFYSIARTVAPVVWVYGDDIIVHTQYADKVIEQLEHYGLVVNRDKTLTHGFFRESCGEDYYRGHNITPIRYRKDAKISVVEFANLLTTAFSDSTGEAVIKWYESINHDIILRLPTHMRENTAFVAFFTSLPSNEILFRRRYNKMLQRYEIRSLATTVRTKVKSLSDSYDALFDWFTTKCKDNSPNIDSMFRRKIGILPRPPKWDTAFDLDKIETAITKTGLAFRWGSINY